MNSISNYLVIIICLVIAIPITKLLINQLGKLFSFKYKANIYLFVTIIPVYKLYQLIKSIDNFYQMPFTYFWIIFLISILIMYYIELKKSKTQ